MRWQVASNLLVAHGVPDPEPAADGMKRALGRIQKRNTLVLENRYIPIKNDFQQLTVRYDREYRAVWYTMEPQGRCCFNQALLTELRSFQDSLVRVSRKAQDKGHDLPVRYTVLASGIPGVFNLGGDLDLFHDLIRNRDRAGLQDYATACIDVLYPNAVNFNLPLTTITLVQGDALGGGCEAAISSNIIVAERQSRFGLPEILFNLIPGMGAYSFLIRRTTPAVTERLITSGEVLSAEQMHELGLVDFLADEGEGPSVVEEILASNERRANAYRALNRVRQCVNPVTYEELIRITGIWVDAALQLRPRDLKMISRLIDAQNRKSTPGDSELKLMEQGG